MRKKPVEDRQLQGEAFVAIGKKWESVISGHWVFAATN